MSYLPLDTLCDNKAHELSALNIHSGIIRHMSYLPLDTLCDNKAHELSALRYTL